MRDELRDWMAAVVVLVFLAGLGLSLVWIAGA
jgi:hypothetical protein